MKGWRVGGFSASLHLSVPLWRVVGQWNSWGPAQGTGDLFGVSIGSHFQGINLLLVCPQEHSCSLQAE